MQRRRILRLVFQAVAALALTALTGAVAFGANVFVLDGISQSVLEYDATGAFVRVFVSSGSGGLGNPQGIAFGPDGNLYVSDAASPTRVVRYNGQTGALMDTFVTPSSGGAVALAGIVFGPNGNLFAADFSAANVKEYDGTTGAFIKVFASTVVASSPVDPLFGPDGNFYLGDEIDIEEFNGATGTFIRSFPQGPGAAAIEPTPIAFGPDGNLYVGTSGPCCPEMAGEILKYDPTTGALIGVFVPAGSGGLQAVGTMAFRPDGKLYVLSTNTAGNQAAKQIMRYDSTTGVFVDVFIAAGNGGLIAANTYTFADVPKYHVCLLYDPTKAVNGGATIPIKLQLCDSNGNDESSSAIVVHATGITQTSTQITGTVEDSGNANPDNDFRFDSTLGTTGGYIFNLSTKGLATGTYSLNFTVTGDSSVYSVSFQVR